jgi:2-methylisocitrate lyase-like PEP mutase family enzyme
LATKDEKFSFFVIATILKSREMIDPKMQQTKAIQFHALHHNGKMLVLPNIWDPLGALLLERLEYPAVATASAPIAFTNGFDDGENILFNEVLKQLTKIVNSINIPVTADIESGYGGTHFELQKNIELIVKTGIAGINIEDTNKQSGKLFSIKEQCERIRLVKKVSSDMDIPLFINARADVYIRGKDFVSDEEKFEEALKRGKEYINAGADCIFPIAMKQKSDIQNLVTALQCPVNILAIPGIPDLKILQEIGVARVSLGPSFLKIAIKAMKQLAIKLKNYEGMNEIEGNDITTDYLKELVNKK